jgi:ABC-type transport system involved in cytochrome c biogenesis permease subunit
MDETAIQSPETARHSANGDSSAIQSAETARTVAAPPQEKGILRLLVQALNALASLRLTVVLFVLSLFLVFAGTLAQVDVGIWTAVNKYFRSAVVWIPFQIFFSRDLKVPGGFPYPGGWLLGGLLLVNLLAAHAVRFKVSWKRSGILILHAGLIVMMLGELITGLFAVEGKMTIEEGASSNYVEQHDEVELAVIDPSDSQFDHVVVVPGSLLRRSHQNREVIQHDDLPFDVVVNRYLVNSGEPRQAGPRDRNPANAGDGVRYVVDERPEVTGTDPDQKVDIPSAYVTFKDKKTGQALGTYLVSPWLSPPLVSRWLSPPLADLPQKVVLGDRTYHAYLRFKRDYKPYTIQLLKFTHEVYPGTDKPKDFASDVRVIDPEANVDREVRIYMNNPLFYGGETFYQSGFLPGDRGTILQVVRNPGWTLPYISCVMVAAGMLIHFLVRLVGFVPPSGKAEPLVGKGRYLPWGVVGLASLYLILIVMPPSYGPEQMNLTEFGKLPVLDGGRIKPMSTLAANSLMVIADRQTFQEEVTEGSRTSSRKQPAIKWLLDVMATPPPGGPAQAHRVFRIENDQLLSLLDLKPRPGLTYSLDEIAPRLGVLSEQAERARQKEPKDLFDHKVINLARQLKVYLDLAHAKEPKGLVPPAGPGEPWRSRAEIEEEGKQLALARLREQVKKGQFDVNNIGAEEVKKFRFEMARARAEVAPPALTAFEEILASYRAQDAGAFNQAVADYHRHLAYVPDKDLRRVRFEAFFNHLEPFYQCSLFYVLVFLMACVSWAVSYEPLKRAAFGLAVLTLVVHSGALIGRMYLMDRPLVFVTNLYSSAVFIGWGCVVLGLVLERIYRNGLGLVASSVLGFVTLIIAHNLAAGGDTLEMLQAVLDTNFWLATHVTCVTIGYVATFVAGALGILFILIGVFTPLLTRDLFKSLAQMIYGVVCFATLFSFVGTVLGGIWADQSWGRFWGWDPKENGALMIVIWNALILHARWAGMVKQRGLAVLAVGGNIITSWSWFGVNMLGVGLHSYGFMSGAVFWLWAAIGAHLCIIAVGLIPTDRWQSFGAEPQPIRSRHRHAHGSA